MNAEDTKTRIQGLLTVAQGYYTQHNWEEAAHYFRSALNSDPDNLQTMVKLGECLLQLENYNEAVTYLEQAYAINPKPSLPFYLDALVGQAKELAITDDEKALELCTRVFSISENHSLAYKLFITIWMRRADAALLRDDLEAAAHAYRQAGDNSRADHIETLYRWQIEAELENHARSLELDERWEEAAAMYEKLLAQATKKEIKQSWKDAYVRCQELAKFHQTFEKGMLAYQEQRWEEAIAVFLQIITERVDYRQKDQWAVDLLSAAVRANTSTFVSGLPTSSPMQLAPTTISEQNARRLVRLARWGNGQVENVAFTPDHRMIVVSSSIGIYLYNAQTLEKIRFIDADAWITSFAVSPDSSTLASGFNDGLIWVWRIYDGTPIRKMRGHNRRINALTFAPDGTWLASGAEDGLVRFWQTSDGRTLHVLEGRLEAVKNLAVAPDGQTVAIVATDAVIRLRRAPDGMLTHALSGHKETVNFAVYAPNGRFLASLSTDGEIKIWNLKKGALSGELTGNSRNLRGLVYSPDGEYLVAGTAKGELVCWSADTGKYLRTFEKAPAAPKMNGLAFSPGSVYLACANEDQIVRIWDVEKGSIYHHLDEFTGKIGGLAFFPNGKTLAAAYADGHLRLWAVGSGQETQKWRAHNEGVLAMVCSPDGQYVVSGGWDNEIRLWQVDRQMVIQVFMNHVTPISTLAFSPDGKFLASGSLDGQIILRRVPTGEVVHNLSGGGGAVRQIVFSPRGTMFATLGDDGGVRIWLASAGQQINLLKGNWGRVTSLSFSHSGAELICGTEEGQMLVWRTTTDWSFVKRFQSTQGPVTRVTVSPVNGLLAAGARDGSISLWTIADESMLNKLEGSGGAILDMAFSPDGTLLASAAEEGVIRLWGVVGG